MAAIALAASLVIMWWSHSRQSLFARQRRSEYLPAKIAGNIFQWSACTTVVLLFYNGLLALLTLGWKRITVDQLKSLEEWFVKAQELADKYKPGWLSSLIALVVLFLFGRSWIRFFEQDTPFRAFKKFNTLVRIICMLLFLLASFTLLGFEPGRTAATLELNLRTDRKEYGLLRADVHQALIAPVVTQICAKVVSQVPGAQSVAKLINKSDDDEAKLHSAYSDARTNYHINDAGVFHQVTENSKLQETPPGTIHDSDALRSNHRPSEDTGEVRDVPGGLTYNDISRAHEEVHVELQKERSRLLGILSEPGAKEIVLKLPEGAVDRIADLLDPIIEAHPFAKPLIDIAKSALSDGLENILKPKLDALTDAIVKKPKETPIILTRAAADVAASTEIKASPEIVARLRDETQTEQRKLTELDGSLERLQAEMRQSDTRRSEPPRQIARNDQPPKRRRARSFDPSYPSPLPDSLGASEIGQGGLGSSVPQYESTVTSCICNRYINGALVSSSRILPGQKCGFQICR